MAGPGAAHPAGTTRSSTQQTTSMPQMMLSNDKQPQSPAVCSSRDTIKAVHACSRDLLQCGPLEAGSKQEGESAWHIVDGKRNKGWNQLAKSLGKTIDDLYLTCELDCNLVNVRSVVHALDDALSDFKQLASQVHKLSKPPELAQSNGGMPGSPKAITWDMKAHPRPNSSPQKRPQGMCSGSTTAHGASHSNGSPVKQRNDEAGHDVQGPVRESKLSAAAKPFEPQRAQQQPSDQHQQQQQQQQQHTEKQQEHKRAPEKLQRQEAQQQQQQQQQQQEGEHGSPTRQRKQQQQQQQQQQQASKSPVSIGQSCSSPSTGRETSSSSGDGSEYAASSSDAVEHNGHCSSSAGSTDGSSRRDAVAAEAYAAADLALRGVHTLPSRPGPGLPRTPLSAPAAARRRSSSTSSIGAGSSDSGAAGAWKGRMNWGSLFERDSASAPPIEIPGRFLHHKLMSPDRMRKTPLETKRAAEERQARAEQLRMALVEERLARLAKAEEGRQHVAAIRAKDVETVSARCDDRHQRSEVLRRAHIKRIQRKAGDETRKVEEVTFINLMSTEGRKKSLQQRLEEGEQRRQEALAAILAKQQGATVAMREAQERRKLLEAERLAQLADKFRRKQLAQAKLEEERRTAALAREQHKEAHRVLAQQAEAARQLEAAERTARINMRLKEAAQRRVRHLELIRDKAAAPGGKDPSERRDSFSLTSPRAPPSPSPARAAATAAAAAAAAAEARAGSTTPTRRFCVSPSADWYQRWTPTSWEGGQSLAVGAVTPASSLRHKLKGARRRAAKLAKRLEDNGCSWEEPAAPQALTASAQAEILHADWAVALAGVQGQEAGSQERRTAFERLALAAAVQLRAHVEVGRHVARQCGLLRAVCAEVSTAAVGCGTGRVGGGSGSSGNRGSAAAAQGQAMMDLLVRLLSEPLNCDYMLALNLAPAFARAAISALDHCNSLGADEGEEEARQTGRLDMLLQVLAVLFSHHPTEPRLLRARDGLLGYSLAVGIVHRISEAFSLFDRPKLATGPVAPYVLQCLQLLHAMTGAAASSEEARSSQGAASVASAGPSSQQQQQQQRQQGELRLRADRRWPTSGPNTAALVIALQETSMAGLLSLLTAVLLHAAPSCTPAEASPDQLPRNFCTAAHLVMATLNNVARLDLLAAQQLLSSTHNRIEFFHLASFLLSYCTNQWPKQGPSTLAAAAAAAAAATLGGQRHAESSGSGSGSASGGRKSPVKSGKGGGSSSSSSSSAGRGSKGSRGAPLRPAAATGSQSALRPSLDAVLAHSTAQPVAELLNEVLLLLGYFCVANPTNQVMLQWGRSPCILQRLAAVPFAYFSDPRLVAVAMPTLLAVCYGVTPACEVMEQSLDAGVLLAYVEEQLQQRQQQQQGQEGQGQQACEQHGEQAQQPKSMLLEGVLARLRGVGDAARPVAAQQFGLAQRFPVELLPLARDFFRARVQIQGAR